MQERQGSPPRAPLSCHNNVSHRHLDAILNGNYTAVPVTLRVNGARGSVAHWGMYSPAVSTRTTTRLRGIWRLRDAEGLTAAAIARRLRTSDRAVVVHALGIYDALRLALDGERHRRVLLRPLPRPLTDTGIRSPC